VVLVFFELSNANNSSGTNQPSGLLDAVEHLEAGMAKKLLDTAKHVTNVIE
jgi:hypothetical protein